MTNCSDCNSTIEVGKEKVVLVKEDIKILCETCYELDCRPYKVFYRDLVVFEGAMIEAADFISDFGRTYNNLLYAVPTR
jgi:NAD-dependent SIR2 family protein deacetylase